MVRVGQQIEDFEFEFYQNQVCPANWRPGQKTLRPDLNLVGKI